MDGDSGAVTKVSISKEHVYVDVWHCDGIAVFFPSQLDESSDPFTQYNRYSAAGRLDQSTVLDSFITSYQLLNFPVHFNCFRTKGIINQCAVFVTMHVLYCELHADGQP